MARAKVIISVILSMVIFCSCFFVAEAKVKFGIPFWRWAYLVEYSDGSYMYVDKLHLDDYKVGVDGVINISSSPVKKFYRPSGSNDDFFNSVTYPCNYSNASYPNVLLNCTDFDVSCRDCSIWVYNPTTQLIYQLSLMTNVVNYMSTYPLYGLLNDNGNLFFGCTAYYRGGSLGTPLFIHFSNNVALKFYRSAVTSIDYSGYVYTSCDITVYDVNDYSIVNTFSMSNQYNLTDLRVDKFNSFDLDFICGFHVQKSNILAYYCIDQYHFVDMSPVESDYYDWLPDNVPYWVPSDYRIDSVYRGVRSDLLNFEFDYPVRTDYDLGNFDIYSFNWVRPVIILPDGHADIKFMDISSIVTDMSGNLYPSVLYGQRCFYNWSGWGDDVLWDGNYPNGTLAVASQVLRPVALFNDEHIVSLDFNRLGVYIDDQVGDFQLALGIFYFDLTDGINPLGAQSIYTATFDDLNTGWNDLSKVVHFRFDPPAGASNFVLFWEVVSDVTYEFFPGNINISSYTDGQLIEINNALVEIDNNQKTVIDIMHDMPSDIAVSVVNEITNSVIYSMDDFISGTGMSVPVVDNIDDFNSAASREHEIRVIIANAINVDSLEFQVSSLGSNITDFSNSFQPAFLFVRNLFDRVVGDGGMSVMVVLLFTLTFGLGVFALGRRLH